MNRSSRLRLGSVRAGVAALKALEAAVECGDLARMEAAREVIENAHRDGFGAVREGWSRDGSQAGSFLDWITGAAAERHINRCLKLSTGRSRDEWWDVI